MSFVPVYDSNSDGGRSFTSSTDSARMDDFSSDDDVNHKRRRIALSNSDNFRDYESVKDRFELTNFKCNSQFYSLNCDNKWVTYNQTSFRTKSEHIQHDEEVFDKRSKCYVTETKCFVSKWFKDDRIRMYNKVQCLPPPLHCDSGTFNLWNGFTVSHLSPCTPDEVIEFKNALDTILDHLKAVAGDNDICYQYLIHWISSIIQLPGTKTKIMPVIKSVAKGAGKGAFKDIMVAMIGADYCYHTSDPNKQVFGNFNNTLRDKLFLSFDEADRSNLAPIMEALKSLITESTQNIRSLYKEMDESSPSFVNVVLLTNQDISWEHNDRRPVYFDMTDRFKGNNDHFTLIYKSLANKRFVRRLYEYFTSIDITHVILEQSRPVTELQRAMEARSSPIEIQFLIHFGFYDRWFINAVTGQDKTEDVKIQGKDLHTQYMRFVENHKDYKPLNAVQFGHKLNDKMREGMSGCSKASNKYGVVYVFKTREFKHWLIKNNYYTDEKLNKCEEVNTYINDYTM